MNDPPSIQRQIVFDVGANDGSSCLQLAVDYPHITVFAFEPTPQLLDVLRERSRHLPNYVIVPKAVSNYSGKATFNVAGQADWGCSSLQEFNPDLSKAWPGRTDFKVTQVIAVEVIKLRDFVEEMNIDQVDFLHVDVQGDDLNVLRGFEDKLSIVQAGVVEAAANSAVALYRGQHTLDDVTLFLQANGFNIVNIESNDVFNNELNVYFQR